MDTMRFDLLARSLTDSLSRRGILGGLAAATGLAAVAFPRAEAKKKRKHKKKKAQVNAFGCLDVGKACGGKGSKCCSGICQGKKPKKGKKDRSRCVGHNVGGCTAGEDQCLNIVQPCGEAGGVCFQTTGKAGFCSVETTGQCEVCGKDADCVALGFGTGAACVVCEFICGATTGGTACAPAAA